MSSTACHVCHDTRPSAHRWASGFAGWCQECDREIGWCCTSTDEYDYAPDTGARLVCVECTGEMKPGFYARLWIDGAWRPILQKFEDEARAWMRGWSAYTGHPRAERVDVVRRAIPDEMSAGDALRELGRE